MNPRRLAVLALALSCTRADPGPAAAADPAEPFAKDDERAVRAALAEATGHPVAEDTCFAWPASFPRVVLVGGFAHDRGCELEGMFVDRTYYAEGGRVEAIATRGFSAAKLEDKESIARAWVDEVLHAFDGAFVTVSTPAFELEGSPKFEPVHVRANKIGGVVVEGWVQRPSGMQDESAFDLVVYRFGPDGAVEAESKRSFAVDGQRLRDAARSKPGG